MRIYSILYRRHANPWYRHPYNVLRLSDLNLPPPPKLAINVKPKHSRLSLISFLHDGGTKMRILQLKHLICSLIRFERIETTLVKGEECRGYVERLIRDAIDYGDSHKPTLEMAAWWLKGHEDLIPKIFKVLAPRYDNLSSCVTQIHKRSTFSIPQCVLELKRNPLPPIQPYERNYEHTLTNILLREVQKDYEAKIKQNELKESNKPEKLITQNTSNQNPENINSKIDLRGIPINIL